MEITLDLPQARTRPTPGAAYAELKSTITRAGLLERRYGYYLWRALASYGILALGLVLPFVNSNRVASVAAGLLIGFGLVQVGLIGHDAGHLQIFRGTRKNWFIGLLAWTVTSGVAFWYWYDRHTRHHANTNDVQRDPDLAGGGMVAYSAEEAQARSGWSRTFAKYQAYLAPLFLLFLMIFVFYMQAEGWVYVLRRLRGRRRALELALLVTHAALYASPFFVLGLRWVWIFVLSQMVAGVYLGLIVAPNHKGMPVWAQGTAPSFMERQVLSSRNVRAHPVWDFIYGGLNYQIEHHLFPTMPRPNFKRAQAIIRPFCLERGLTYEEMDPWASYRAAYDELRRVGLAAA